jgi:(p)ppGpp synthase/HD superfamily hydrolase
MEKTMPKTLLTQRFVEAMQYAIAAHGGQVRKGTDVTYVAHLLGVASLVLEHGGSEDDAMAGLLHDTIEDCGEHHDASIRARFGGDVADIVLGLTDGTQEAKARFTTLEEKRKDWKQRKEKYLGQLRGHDERTLRVSCCDKLYNARAIVSDLHAIGFDVFRRFTAGTKGTLWYYAELAKVFEQRQVGPAMELSRTVREMARLAEGAPR